MTEHENPVSEEKKNSGVGEPSEQDSESQAWNLRQAGPLFSLTSSSAPNPHHVITTGISKLGKLLSHLQHNYPNFKNALIHKPSQPGSLTPALLTAGSQDNWANNTIKQGDGKIYNFFLLNLAP